MLKYLGRKQTSNQSDWLYALEHIEEFISPEEVNAYADNAVRAISKATDGKKAAYAWSGGKDSIVLGDLCEKAGVRKGYYAFSDLDYPEFVKWCVENRPNSVELMHTGYNLEWLSNHQDLIFAEGTTGQRWHLINQRKPFTKMFFDNGLDVLIVGHRIIDGNVCGSEGYIKKRSGETRFTPIADWPHEAILGYIHYNGLELPPIYQWKDGFVIGTHAWPEREFCKTLNQGYREVYQIDPNVIYAAAEKIPSARRFLETEVAK